MYRTSDMSLQISNAIFGKGLMHIFSIFHYHYIWQDSCLSAFLELFNSAIYNAANSPYLAYLLSYVNIRTKIALIETKYGLVDGF